MTNSKKIRKLGIDGENSVAAFLGNLPAEEYYIINNLLLKTPKGSTQIDHVVVSPYGVFVIETKNHKGMIFGDCFSKDWTQTLYTKRGIKSFTFYSPYLQNIGHINHLIKDYGIPPQVLQGMIVFSNVNANLRNVNCITFNPYTMFHYIRQHTIPIINYTEMLNIISCLHYNNIESARNNKRHIKFVKSMKLGG